VFKVQSSAFHVQSSEFRGSKVQTLGKEFARRQERRDDSAMATLLIGIIIASVLAIAFWITQLVKDV